MKNDGLLGAKLQSDESRAILGAMFEARAEYLQAAIDEVKSNTVRLKRMLKSSRLYERVIRGNESVIARREIGGGRLIGLASCSYYEIFRCLIIPITIGITVPINNIGKNNFPKPPLHFKAIEMVSN